MRLETERLQILHISSGGLQRPPRCPQQSLTFPDLKLFFCSARICIPVKMSMRYLGFVLLIWLPGALQAQHCSPPSLEDGYFIPNKVNYPHKSLIFYACGNGRKPAVDGWWATSTCEGGRWSHEPQCIDETTCLRLEIPNAKDNDNRNDWYMHRDKIRITCEEGYELKKGDATAVCLNGIWTSVPICEISDTTCGEPPKILHAVIVGQNYQKVFASDSTARYECEDGYTEEGAVSKKTIICIQGSWTEGPTCSKKPRQGTGHVRTEEVEQSGRHTTSTGRETGPNTGSRGSTVSGRVEQPLGGNGNRQDTRQDGSTVDGAVGGPPTSAGRVTPGLSGGSSTISGVDDRHSKPLIVSVDQCGQFPVVLNGVVVQMEGMHLKYQCNGFYTRVGPEQVVCYNDGTWSEQPICKEAFCIVDLALYSRIGISQTGTEYVKEGESQYFSCYTNHYRDHFIVFTCTKGRTFYTDCCHDYYHRHNQCRSYKKQTTAEELLMD
ncbi:complement factor H-related protein 4-like [Notolabrus celidotus]|uniref:complement factor H-related protein 4-like n=1 Tax=Notolabrus celidotus TaxID=1203425 RepID=UPI0014900341|nr:complement factor H-related protein 4-like [Notolabrus celidotus]